ncbi:hypothetical protein VFPFJ_07126 [Purpureocillium lilacinum]|uniref:Uncharacterized protein n=1 Tax=Purpureocillium lilacinum TaxID=33203 RepID=A0A179HGG7_PURLI|nr:hypothetical protein VFPFJ_07126 [Purpureocillium lilacinum]OAQ79936.1 hypothetical protein VFPBJ_05521 [Purpureocillium lilacinum]OAQ88661.1 hypothetical protein VFPFJ_07126 [Purpureocillium lilacinum]
MGSGRTGGKRLLQAPQYSHHWTLWPNWARQIRVLVPPCITALTSAVLHMFRCLLTCEFPEQRSWHRHQLFRV